VVAGVPGNASLMSRRALITRLAAAGFAAPVIASMLADGAWAQDAATPMAETFTSPFTTIPPNDDPAKSLASIGVDQPLIPHGGFNFGTPPGLVAGLIVANDAFFIRSHGPSANLDDLSKYTLQVAAYGSRADADALAKRLKARGIDVRVSGTARMFRVRIGRYETRAAAAAAARDLKAKKIDAFVTEIGGDDK